MRQLVVTVEEQGIILFNDLDIKKMKGEWEGFYRLRVGKNRVVFGDIFVLIGSAKDTIKIIGDIVETTSNLVKWDLVS